MLSENVRWGDGLHHEHWNTSGKSFWNIWTSRLLGFKICVFFWQGVSLVVFSATTFLCCFEKTRGFYRDIYMKSKKRKLTKMKPEKGSKIGREKIIWTKAPFKNLNRICILYKAIERRGSLIARSTFHNPKLVVCDFPWFWPFSCYYGVMQNTKKTWELTVGPIPHMEPTKKSKNPWREYFHPEIFISIKKKQPKKILWCLSDPFFWGCRISDPEIKGCCWWPPTGRCFNNSRDSHRILPDVFFSTFFEGLKQPSSSFYLTNPNNQGTMIFLENPSKIYPIHLHQKLDPPQKIGDIFMTPKPHLQHDNQLHP